jgi:hypothetical protein
MVPSLKFIVAVDGEQLSCNVFSLGNTIRLRSLEFIADHFSGLSLSPMGDSSDAAVIGSTRSGPPSPLRAMTGDSIEEFHTGTDGEGSVNLPSPRRHGTGALTTPATTISWSETSPTAQAMRTILPRQAVPEHDLRSGRKGS